MKERKKFKDTAVGKFLTERIPDAVPAILDAVDDLIPGAKIITAIVGKRLSPEDQIKFDALLLEYEQTERKDYLADLANARSREVDFVKATGGADKLMSLVCIVVLVGFVFCLIVSAFFTVSDDMRDSFLEMRTTVRDAIIMVLSYYFGASIKRSQESKPLARI